MKLRLACIGSLAAWFIFVTGWFLHEEYLTRLVQPALTMERCVAGEVWGRLCYDRNWREHWQPPDCDLCLPGWDKVPTEAQYEYDCRLDVIRKTCTPQVAWSEREGRDSRVAAAFLLAIAYLGPPFMLALPLLSWRRLRRRTIRPVQQWQPSTVERARR